MWGGFLEPKSGGFGSGVPCSGGEAWIGLGTDEIGGAIDGFHEVSLLGN
jgi:hypothetical protein